MIEPAIGFGVIVVFWFIYGLVLDRDLGYAVRKTGELFMLPLVFWLACEVIGTVAIFVWVKAL